MSQPLPRRWLQFSLRTLFVLMLLVAAFFGGRGSMKPAIQAERIKAEQAQAEAIMARAAAVMDSELARIFEQQSRRPKEQSKATSQGAATQSDAAEPGATPDQDC